MLRYDIEDAFVCWKKSHVRLLELLQAMYLYVASGSQIAMFLAFYQWRVTHQHNRLVLSWRLDTASKVWQQQHIGSLIRAWSKQAGRKLSAVSTATREVAKKRTILQKMLMESAFSHWKTKHLQLLLLLQAIKRFLMYGCQTKLYSGFYQWQLVTKGKLEIAAVRLNGVQTLYRLLLNVLRPRVLVQCLRHWRVNLHMVQTHWRVNLHMVQTLLQVGDVSSINRKNMHRVLGIWQTGALRYQVLVARREITLLRCKVRGVEEREVAVLRIQERMSKKY